MRWDQQGGGFKQGGIVEWKRREATGGLAKALPRDSGRVEGSGNSAAFVTRWRA